MRIDDRARRALLIARHHLGRTGHDALSATRDLLALHSSDPATPHLALWARVDRYQPADLERALEAELCRLHAMRRTLWIAATDEVPTLDASVTRDIAAKERRGYGRRSRRRTSWVMDATWVPSGVNTLPMVRPRAPPS